MGRKKFEDRPVDPVKIEGKGSDHEEDLKGDKEIGQSRSQKNKRPASIPLHLHSPLSPSLDCPLIIPEALYLSAARQKYSRPSDGAIGP